LLQENGPFLWQPGVFKPVENQWSWHRLTNVVWVDQPIGSGFSQGTVTAKDEHDVASQFMGFWKNFVDTFAMQGYKVYVTGSSYSGIYSPYVASGMLDANDKNYFNVSGMMIFDGLYSADALSQQIPVVPFVDSWSRVFSFNDSFSSQIHDMADKCGYNDYLDKYLVFPPSGVQPSVLPGSLENGTTMDSCDAIDMVFTAAQELNPCFSVYEIFDACPFVFDPLGFSAGTNFVPAGAGPVYFNRTDVKQAIHAPVNATWQFCSSEPVFVDGIDNSILAGPGSQPVIPNVIEKTHNVLIGHGSQDFVLVADGTLLSIQNMTWGGMLGFQTRPTEPLYVPYHGDGDIESLSGAGVVGTVHTERGLTYFGVASAGHFLTQDQPAIAYRGLEVLLGRVSSLQAVVPFTTDVNATAQPVVTMGNGTVFTGLSTAGDGICFSNSNSNTPQKIENGAPRKLSVAVPLTSLLVVVSVMMSL
jgi:carboxypeptidase D